MFYGLHQDYDISKSKKELDVNPKSLKKPLEDALRYLKEDCKKQKNI